MRIGQPEIPCGFDTGAHRSDLAAGISQQFKYRNKAAVVAQQNFFRNLLAQRQHLIALVPCLLPLAVPLAMYRTRFGLRVHGHGCHLMQRLGIQGLGPCHACRAEVEQGQLEADFITALARRWRLGDTRRAEFQHVDKACRTRQSERLRQ